MRTSRPPNKPLPPATYERIVNVITHDYAELSERLQQIARYVTQNPNTIALESINTIARNCGVHASTLVRFAQYFGYSGFKQLQKVFQTRLATAAPGFRERISALDTEVARTSSQSNQNILRDLIIRDIASLQNLLTSVSEKSLVQAGHLLANANNIYVAGQLRSAPMASLMRYLLSMLRRKVILLDPSGGLAQEMAATMGRKDVLVAIAFQHYAKEVVAISEIAATNRTPVIAITDSTLSPLSKDARLIFTIPEEEYAFARSLAAPMSLVQCLAVVTAVALHPASKTTPRIPTVTELVRSRERSA